MVLFWSQIRFLTSSQFSLFTLRERYYTSLHRQRQQASTLWLCLLLANLFVLSGGTARAQAPAAPGAPAASGVTQNGVTVTAPDPLPANASSLTLQQRVRINEQQQIALSNVTAGEVAISDGQGSVQFAPGATAAQVQTALEGLPTVGAGNVTVTGSSTAGSASTPVFSAVSNYSSGGSYVTSGSFSHTVSAGNNRLLLLGFAFRNNSGVAVQVNSASYGGMNLTHVGKIGNGTNAYVELWHLAAPPTGTNTVTFSLSASAFTTVGATSFTGVDQTTPLGTVATSIGTSTTPSVTVTSAAGEIVLDAIAAQGMMNTPVAGANQTQHWNVAASPGSIQSIGIRGAGSTKAGAATVTTSWTTYYNNPWAMAAVPIKGAPGPSSGTYTVEFTGAKAGTNFGQLTSSTAGVTVSTTQQGSDTWVDVATNVLAGHTVAVGDLAADTGYELRWMAVGAGGTTAGDSVPFTTLPDAPATPGLAAFGNITHNGVRVMAPILPARATSLTLQRKPYGAADSLYATVESGLGSLATTDITNLDANTAYTFRYVAVNSGGTAPGDGADVTTAPAPPAAPTFSAVAYNSLNVTAPALPDGAGSLTLQRKPQGEPDDTYSTVITGVAGGAPTPVVGLIANTAYTFRWLAIGTAGSTAGPSASVTTPPSPPAAPSFSNLAYNGVRVTAPSLPEGADSLTLQQKLQSEGSGAYTEIAAGLVGGAARDVSSLSPNTAYSFRYVAVGAHGSTNGTAASVTTAYTPPNTPPAPALSNITQVDADVTAPDPLPAHTSSLTLQRRALINEDQQITLSNVSANQVTISDGQGSAQFAPGATAAQVQAALENLPTIDSGNVTVTGSTTAETVASPIFDAATAVGPGYVASGSFSHTTAGSNRLLLVAFSFKYTGVGVSAVTYGGTAMTRVTPVGGITSAESRVEVWKLVAPPLGANPLNYTLTGSAEVAVGATSFKEVNQTTPLGTLASSTGSSGTSSLTVASGSGELVLDALAATSNTNTNAVTANTGQTQRWSAISVSPPGDEEEDVPVEGPGGLMWVWGAGSTKSGAASVTTGWTISSARSWAMAGISIKGLAAPGSGSYTVEFIGAKAGTDMPQLSSSTSGVSVSTLRQGGYAWLDQQANVLAGHTVNLAGLTADTSYPLRWLAVGPGGTTEGPAATLTTKRLKRTWGPDTGLLTAAGAAPAMTAPVVDHKVAVGESVALAVDEVTDIDNWVQGSNSGTDTDPISYQWSATDSAGAAAGSFPDGADGRTLNWVAPATPGTYSLKCVIEDIPTAVEDPDDGSRNDNGWELAREITVSRLDHLQYMDVIKNTPWQDLPESGIVVPLGTQLAFQAVSNQGFPTGKPVWGGTALTVENGVTNPPAVSCNTPGTYTLSATCGNTKPASITVVQAGFAAPSAIVKVGQSIAASAIVNPGTAVDQLVFESAEQTIATVQVTDSQAGTVSLSIHGVSLGSTEIRARLGQGADAPVLAILNVWVNRTGLASGEVAVQPSLLIRNSDETVYQEDGKSRLQVPLPGNTAEYSVLVRNDNISEDNSGSDTLHVTGPAGTDGWSIQYFDSATGGEITNDVVSPTGWPTSLLAEGGTAEMTVKVTAPAGVLVDDQYNVALTVKSARNTAKQDGVTASAIPLLPPADLQINPNDLVHDDLHLAQADRHIGLKWTGSVGATLYKIYRRTGTSGSFAEIDMAGRTGHHSFVNFYLRNDTTYYYTVRAVNAKGEISADSAIVNQKTLALAAPVIHTATGGDKAVDLEWNAVDRAANYRIYRATSTAGSYALIGTSPTASFTNNALINGMNYHYKVRAWNSGGEGPDSNIEYAEVRGAKPAAPVLLTPTAGDARTFLRWTGSIGARYYRIYRATAGAGNAPPADTDYQHIATTGHHSYLDSNLANGTTYYYKVTAEDAVPQESDASNVVNATPGGASVDLMIRALSELEYVGQNLYDIDGSGQSVSQATSANTAAVYILKLVNKGQAAAHFKLRGPAGVDGWQVKYFSNVEGGAEHEITLAVTNNGWETPVELAINGEQLLRVEVTPAAGVAEDAPYAVVVTAEKAVAPGAPPELDAVRAIARRERQVKELRYRLNNDASWLPVPEDGVKGVEPGAIIRFKAVMNPETDPWPSGKPVWGGDIDAVASETDPAITNPILLTDNGVFEVTAECGIVLKAKVVVQVNAQPNLSIRLVPQAGEEQLPEKGITELNPSLGTILESQKQPAVITNGLSRSFLVKVKNAGSSQATYNITLPVPPSGWQVTLKTTTGTISDVTTQAQSAQGWPVTVAASNFTELKLDITAESGDNAATEDYTAEVRAQVGALHDGVGAVGALQNIAKLLWRTSSGTWEDVTPTTVIVATQGVATGVRVVKRMPDQEWIHVTQGVVGTIPLWQVGARSIEAETLYIAFDIPTTSAQTLQTLQVQCGNSKSVQVQVRPVGDVILGAGSGFALAGAGPLESKQVALRARVEDRRGAPLPGTKVKFTATHADGAAAGSFGPDSPASVVAPVGADGIATATWTSGTRDGQIIFKAQMVDYDDTLLTDSDTIEILASKPYTRVAYGPWDVDANGAWSRSVKAAIWFNGQRVGGRSVTLTPGVSLDGTPVAGNPAPLDAVIGSTGVAGVFTTTQRWNPPQAGDWPHDYAISVQAIAGD